MLITVGSCIGAGIFFKNASILSNTGSIAMTIVSWLIAIIGILAIAFTLTDLVKGSGEHNSLGIIGWIRGFCGNYVYKGFRNFMMFVYLPTNFFVMPYYAVMSIQDAFNVFNPDKVVIPTWAVILLSAGIMLYFTTTCSLSIKLASHQNIIITAVKFLPLLFAIVAGIWIFAYHGGKPSNLPVWPTSNFDKLVYETTPKKFYQFAPAILGVIASIPAIFFAFDGFYSASASQHKMEQPHRSSSAMALGIAIVAAIYVLISIALLLGAEGGSFFGLNIEELKNKTWWKILMFIMLIFVAVAVFGVINGFAIYGADFYRDLIKRDEAPLSNWYKNKFGIESRFGIMFYTISIYSISFVLCTIIGCFYFYNGPYKPTDGLTDYYGDRVTRLYNFCDLISNWASLIVFVGLGAAIFGALFKKYKNKAHQTSKWFVPCAFIGVGLIVISVLYEYIANFYDLSSSITFTTQHKSSMSEFVIPSILQTLLLIGFSLMLGLSGLSKKPLRK